MSNSEPAVLLLLPGISLDAVSPALQALGLHATPMHPGSDDPSLRGWHVLRQVRPGDLDAALARLRQVPGVDGAYRKPEGEAPG